MITHALGSELKVIKNKLQLLHVDHSGHCHRERARDLVGAHITIERPTKRRC